jgi:hypothetical protein
MQTLNLGNVLMKKCQKLYGIEINPTTPEDIALQEKAKNLR